jgi:hypothetical protein
MGVAYVGWSHLRHWFVCGIGLGVLVRHGFGCFSAALDWVVRCGMGWVVWVWCGCGIGLGGLVWHALRWYGCGVGLSVLVWHGLRWSHLRHWFGCFSAAWVWVVR